MSETGSASSGRSSAKMNISSSDEESAKSPPPHSNVSLESADREEGELSQSDPEGHPDQDKAWIMKLKKASEKARLLRSPRSSLDSTFEGEQIIGRMEPLVTRPISTFEKIENRKIDIDFPQANAMDSLARPSFSPVPPARTSSEREPEERSSSNLPSSVVRVREVQIANYGLSQPALERASISQSSVEQPLPEHELYMSLDLRERLAFSRKSRTYDDPRQPMDHEDKASVIISPNNRRSPFQGESSSYYDTGRNRADTNNQCSSGSREHEAGLVGVMRPTGSSPDRAESHRHRTSRKHRSVAEERFQDEVLSLRRLNADRVSNRQLASRFWHEAIDDEAAGRRSLSIEADCGRVSWNRSSEDSADRFSFQDACDGLTDTVRRRKIRQGRQPSRSTSLSRTIPRPRVSSRSRTRSRSRSRSIRLRPRSRAKSRTRTRSRSRTPLRSTVTVTVRTRTRSRSQSGHRSRVRSPNGSSSSHEEGELRSRSKKHKKEKKVAKKSKKKKRAASKHRSRSRSNPARDLPRLRSTSPPKRKKSKTHKARKRDVTQDEVANIVRERRKLKKNLEAVDSAIAHSRQYSPILSDERESPARPPSDMSIESQTETPAHLVTAIETPKRNFTENSEKSDEAVCRMARSWSEIAKFRSVLTQDKLRETGWTLSQRLVENGLLSPDEQQPKPPVASKALDSMQPTTSANLYQPKTPPASVPLPPGLPPIVAHSIPLPSPLEVSTPSGSVYNINMCNPTVPEQSVSASKRSKSPPTSVTSMLWTAAKEQRAAQKELAQAKQSTSNGASPQLYTSRAAEANEKASVVGDEPPPADTDLRDLDPMRRVDVSNPADTATQMWNALRSGQPEAFQEILSKRQTAEKEAAAGSRAPLTVSTSAPVTSSLVATTVRADSVASTFLAAYKAKEYFTRYTETYGSTTSSVKRNLSKKREPDRNAGLAETRGFRVAAPEAPANDRETSASDSPAARLAALLDQHYSSSWKASSESQDHSAKATPPFTGSAAAAQSSISPVLHASVTARVLVADASVTRRPSFSPDIVMVPPPGTADSVFNALQDSLTSPPLSDPGGALAPYSISPANSEEACASNASAQSEESEVVVVDQVVLDVEEMHRAREAKHRARIMALLSHGGRLATHSSNKSLRMIRYGRGVVKRTLNQQRALERFRASKNNVHYGDTLPITWLSAEKKSLIVGILRHMCEEND